MNYYQTSTTSTVSERQVIKANPNTSFPTPFSSAVLSDFGLLVLDYDAKPSITDSQKVIEGDIEVRDGVAYQTYSAVDKSADRIAAELASKQKNVRSRRNAELSATDWAVLSDTALSGADETIYINYRTALRDVPAQPGFPDNALPEGPHQQPEEGTWTYDPINFVWKAA
jgi:hypothetical protein|tara:strand:+ start:238 stop:747 length:510 start_codon:yes stop_codon:yes gene_type:complete